MKKPVFRFCPLCGHRFVLKRLNGVSRLVCGSCGFVFYRNAVPAVCVLIIRRGKILLVRRAVYPRKGWWDVPGGFVEQSEHPDHAVVRELREELGVTVRRFSPLGMLVDTYYVENGPNSKVLNIYYRVASFTGKLKPHDDISEARWFPLDRLPPQIAFKHIHIAVGRWVKR